MKRKMLVALTMVLVVALTFSQVALAAEYSWRYGDNTLKRSSTVKTVVKNVQADYTLNTSYNLVHDGIYGSNTFRAAKEFQAKKNLSVDGETGKNTKTKLYPLRNVAFNY